MKNITINIPFLFNDVLNRFKEMKIVPSRSEAIRWALRDFLSKELKIIEISEAYLNEDSDS